MSRIVDKFLKELDLQVTQQNIKLEISEAARNYLSTKGYDQALGARPLARLIQNEIKKPLSEIILRLETKTAKTIQINLDNNKLEICEV